MFRIEMLPASNGDCLWIEYGSASDVHRVLIDGGLAGTYPALRARILALPQAERVFELLMVTHVDNDHIEGVIPLLQDTDLGCTFDDVWYNGWSHLEELPDSPTPEDVLGAREGEFLGLLIDDRALAWNRAFGGQPIEVPNEGALPAVTLAGGLRLTLLSPTRRRLIALKLAWRKAAEDANFIPGDEASVRSQLVRRRYLPVPAGVLGVEDGPPGRDNAEANGSSIAVLAEYDGVKALLTGDAHADVLEAGLGRLGATPAAPLKLDAWKLAHHGSWQNFTPELMRLIRTPRYLVSTNGRKPFNHPHAKTLDSIIDNHPRGKPELVFNYRVPTTEAWANSQHPRAGEFIATYPAGSVLLL